VELSNLYSAGKFVDDGVFDQDAVSKQCEAAVMLRVLQERGAV
jgi:lysozyme family protein